MWRNLVAGATLARALRRAIAIVSSVVMLLGITTPASAEVYKWQDAKGKLHFSDHPPTASQGAPSVQMLTGIPRSIQEQIRAAAPDGIEVRGIRGDDRDCEIDGEAESHSALVAFAARLRTEGLGETPTELGNGRGPAMGAEVFALHLRLNADLLERARRAPSPKTSN